MSLSISGGFSAPQSTPRCSSSACSTSNKKIDKQPTASEDTPHHLRESSQRSLAAPKFNLGPSEFGGLTSQGAQLSLRIRSNSSVSVRDDGTITERSSSRLGFRYDLTTEDGQHVQLKIKAKVQQVAIQDEDGNVAIKSRVKLQFSLLQEGVANGLSPLLHSDQVPSDAQAEIADQLQAFSGSIGDVLQQFTDGEQRSTDALIQGSVDTFNKLIDAIAGLLGGNPSSGPPDDSAPAALPDNGAQIDLASAIAEPAADIAALATVPIPAAPSTVSDGPVTTVIEPAATALVSATPDEQLADDHPDVAADSTEVVASAPPKDTVVATPAPSDVGQPAPSATQVLQSVRISFVQSLSQVIRTLTPDDQSGRLIFDQQLTYKSSLSLKIHSFSLLDLNA